MKEITLNFREVAVDGLPEKSMSNVFVFYGYGTAIVRYSDVNKCWNCGDTSDEKHVSESRLAFNDVTHWCPLVDLYTVLEEDAQNVQTLG